MKRHREGDEDAWSALYQRYADHVLGIARREGLSAQPAEDVVHVVFAELIEGVRKFKRGRDGDFRAWLSRRLQGRIRDVTHGAQGRFPNVLACRKDAAPASSESDALCGGLWDEVWREARPRLSAVQVQVLEGLLEGKTPEQLADEVGITRNHLYQEKHRALRRLRDIAKGLRQAGCRHGPT